MKIEKIVLNYNKYLNIMRKNPKIGKAFRFEDAKGRYSEFLKNSGPKFDNSI